MAERSRTRSHISDLTSNHSYHSSATSAHPPSTVDRTASWVNEDVTGTTSSSDREISFKTVDKALSAIGESKQGTEVGSLGGRSQNRSSRSRHSTARSVTHKSVIDETRRSGSMNSSSAYRLDTIEADVNIMRSDIRGVKDTMDGVTAQLAILVEAAMEAASKPSKTDKGAPQKSIRSKLHPSNMQPHGQPSDTPTSEATGGAGTVFPPPA